MSRDEANEAARDLLRENPKMTVRELARRIGCSEGLIGSLREYRAVRERLNAGDTPKRAKVVSLTGDVLATVGTRDEALERLRAGELERVKAEQAAEYEPSPLDDDAPNWPRRVRRPR